MNTTVYATRKSVSDYKRYREMLDIKLNGTLIGIYAPDEPNCGWQYWMNGDFVWSVPSDGDVSRMGIFCIRSEFKNHLMNLMNITGKRWEDSLIVIHPELLPNY